MTMKGSIQSNNFHTFVVEHDVDAMHDQYSSKKELSKGFATSHSSSFLDETASNSSLSSSCFSLSSAISLNYLSERLHPPDLKCSSVATNNAVPVRSRMPSLSQVSTGANEKQNNGGVQQSRYRRLSPQTLFQIFPFQRDQVVWEEVEDDLYILLDGRLDRLKICEEFFFQRNIPSEGRLEPIRSCEFLKSLSYLLSSKHENMAMHDEHVSRLASFLSTGRDARHLKLAFVRTLYKMFLLPENEVYAVNKNHTGTHDGAERLYEFLTNRRQEWDEAFTDKLSVLTIGLLYEIRAKCLRNLDLKTDRIRSVSDKGDNTAVIIAMGARVLELGIQKSNKAIEGQISNAGRKMKVWIDDINVKGDHQSKGESRIVLNNSNRDAVVVRAVSKSTKRASEYAKQSSNRVARSTLDTTLSGLYTIGNKVEESTDMIDQLSPESREMIKAAGKIGIASVGAVALVTEAVIETSRSISSKAVGVTADIVGHKYGSVAGEVARDAAETYTNVLETMGNITLASNGSKLVKKAAKNVGKNQIGEDVEKAKQIFQKLERQGAMVAQQTLGIQWNEGSLTRELLSAASDYENGHESAVFQPKDNLSIDDNKNSSQNIHTSMLYNQDEKPDIFSAIQ